MGFIAQLRRGKKIFPLSGANFDLALDFVPPSTQIEYTIAFGTSANRYGGGLLVDARSAPDGYSLHLKVIGGTNAEVEGNIQTLASFLAEAGNPADPTYLEWRSNNSVPFEPKHGSGYGALYQLEILGASNYNKWDLYTSTFEQGTFIAVPLLLNFPVRTQRITFGLASGGIKDDVFFSPNGISRGLNIPEATTNKATNPVFGHSTWNTGWSAGSDLIASKNTDKDFILPGAVASAKLSRIGNTNIAFTLTLNLGNTNQHTHTAYVKKADGSIATASEVRIYYGSAQTSTYRYMGNGITRVHWTGAGIASNTATGVSLMTLGITIYLLAYQVEEKTYPTLPCWGDLVGCAWTGTAHNSTSTRTASILKYVSTDVLDIGEFTAVLIWMPDRDSSEFTGAATRMFHDGTLFGGLTTAPAYTFSDGTATITGATVTFSAGDIEVLHFIAGPSGLRILRNGALYASNTSYTPRAFGADFTVGSTTTSTQHVGGTFLDFHTYARALSNTQGLAEHTNLTELAGSGDGYGMRVETLPWLYSVDGDAVVDAYVDSTHRDWLLAGGVPGNLPAETLIEVLDNSSGARNVMLSNYHQEQYVNPGDMFVDASGTVDAAALGGQAATVTVTTITAVLAPQAISIPINLSGEQNVVIHVSLRDPSGTNLEIASRVEFGTDIFLQYYFSDWQSISSVATYNLYRTKPVMLPDRRHTSYPWLSAAAATLKVALALRRKPGTANNDVLVDYLRLLVGDLAFAQNDHANANYQIFDGRLVTQLEFTGGVYTVKGWRQNTGQVIELRPETLNHLVLLPGADKDSTQITFTGKLNRLSVTPRWALE